MSVQSSEVSRPPDNRNTAAVSSILVAPECWILVLIDPLRDRTLALGLAQLGLAALVQLVLILEAPRLDLGVRGLPQPGVYSYSLKRSISSLKSVRAVFTYAGASLAMSLILPVVVDARPNSFRHHDLDSAVAAFSLA